MRNMLFMIPLALLLVACGDEPTPAPKPASAGAPAASGGEASHHGAIVALGQVRLGDEQFAIARHGACTPGREGAVVVSRIGGGASTGLSLWVTDASGAQISAPAQGDRTGDDWHFHVTPRADAGTPEQVVLRLREGAVDVRASVPVHAGAAPVHDGVVAPLHAPDGEVAGWLELKLHDDKGDLELWLAQDGAMHRPLDLPLDAVVTATFPDQTGRTVELRARNAGKNEDEDGQPNVRDGRTNYLIFPGATGADASWLMGADFRSAVTVTVTRDGTSLTAGPFVLVPHGHGPDGHEH